MLNSRFFVIDNVNYYNKKKSLNIKYFRNEIKYPRFYSPACKNNQITNSTTTTKNIGSLLMSIFEMYIKLFFNSYLR